MKARIAIGTVAMAAVLTAVAVLLFHPNPYGNNPEAVGDESMFLYSVAAPLLHGTLPGWEFTVSPGAYYGGPFIYVAGTLLAPVFAAVYFASGSLASARAIVLAGAGDFQHLIRLVDGLLVFLFLYYGFSRTARDGDPDGTRGWWLLVGLLLGNAVFLTMAMTAKVWIPQMLLELTAGLLVWRQEQLRTQERAMEPRTYASVLLWLALLAFLQNPGPGAMTAAWIVYALILGHLRFADLLAALRKWWLPMVFAAALQAAFFYRFYEILVPRVSLLNPTNNSFLTDGGTRLNFIEQTLWPFRTLFASQPLLLPMLTLLALQDLWRALRGGLKSIDRLRWRLILYVNPVLTFVAYYYVMQFGIHVRYVLPFTIAFTLSIVLLMKPGKLMAAFLALSWILAIPTVVQTARLAWSPSSERQVAAFFDAQGLGAGDVVFTTASQLTAMTDAIGPSAATIIRVDGDLAEAERQHASDIAAARHAWSVVYTGYYGDDPCGPRELADKTCFGFNPGVEHPGIQNAATLPQLYVAPSLGYAYAIRNLKP